MFLAEQNSIPIEGIKTIGNNNIFNKKKIRRNRKY
jgi:hypothetical protein